MLSSVQKLLDKNISTAKIVMFDLNMARYLKKIEFNTISYMVWFCMITFKM